MLVIVCLLAFPVSKLEGKRSAIVGLLETGCTEPSGMLTVCNSYRAIACDVHTQICIGWWLLIFVAQLLFSGSC